MRNCKPPFFPLYLVLGNDKLQREIAYRDLFKPHIDGPMIEDIRNSINRGLALRSSKFKDEIEFLTGRRMNQGKRGRPEGWREPS
jgi:putative transposase